MPTLDRHTVAAVALSGTFFNLLGASYLVGGVPLCCGFVLDSLESWLTLFDVPIR